MRRFAALSLAGLFTFALGCSESTMEAPMDDGQDHVRLGPSFSASAASTYNIVGVGANFGVAAASQICSSGDLACTYTEISEAAFNAMSVAALRAAYDVLIFTWISNGVLNADWNTRLVPYMNMGGGILFEDPGNLGDLAPGVTAFNFDTGSGAMTISAVVPGLTDGINNSFANNHIGFSAWDPALSPFIDNGGTTVGLQGRFGAGCIVLTGPDQHFHGFRGAGGAAGNQYNLLLNEVKFVLGLQGQCRLIPVDVDIKPGSFPNSVNLGAKGVIPVAILTTASFNAADVDPSTVTLGNDSGVETPIALRNNGTRHASLEDVDGDGDLDLSMRFSQPALEANGDLTATTTSLTINGKTWGGTPIKGSDSVKMTPASSK